MRLHRPACLAAAALLALAGCGREPAVSSASAPAALRVATAPVQREIAPLAVELPGVVRPSERAVIAAKISGVIASLPVSLGQSVKAGDLLARLAAPELAARLAQARAQLESAQREEQRNRALAAAGAETEDAATAAAERLRGASAAVAEAESMLAYTEIRAPYDARVAEKFVYAGDLASPGQPLLVLERASALRVEAAVPSSLAGSLALGAELPVLIAGAAATTGRVAEIAAAADAATHTVLVKLDLLASTPVWSGRAVRVQLPGEPAELLLAPASAVSRFGQMERVFVVADGQARLRLVKTGARHGDRLELLSGVAEGERLVLAPPGTLRDGQPVTLAP